MLVSMRGWLDVTDGTNAARIVGQSDVAIEIPVRWEPVPPGATVLSDR